MLVCSAAWKVHASRGSVPGCQMILMTRWCLVRFIFHSGVLVGSFVICFRSPELGGAHRPTGRLWPAGCGSARQPKPSVTTGGANSWQ